jgi:hypothetical protein
MRFTARLKILVPLLIVVAGALPGAAFAQENPPLAQPPHEAAFCGSVDLPVLRSDTLMFPQPDTLMQERGVENFSAVRGSIVHMEGDLVLLKLDGAGMGNAAPNRELAGDQFAVVRLPGECAGSTFEMGMPILAVGTPNAGILDAIEVGMQA